MPLQSKGNNKRGGIMNTNKSSKPEASSKDERHNNQQPCCEILTRFALQVLPAVASSAIDLDDSQSNKSRNKNNPKMNGSNHGGNSGIQQQQQQHNPFPILLRDYLLDQHAQRQKLRNANAISLLQSNGNKKKRKKKKKKNLNSNDSPNVEDEAETTHLEQNVEYTPSSAQPTSTQDDALSSQLTNTTKRPESPFVGSCNDTAEVPQEFAHDATPIVGESSKAHQQKYEQQRRIQSLIDQFLDRYVVASQRTTTGSTSSSANNSAVDPSESFAMNGNSGNNNNSTTSTAKPVDLQPLHSYIATLSDDVSKERTDTVARNGNNNNLPTLLSVSHVRAAVEDIACPACRRDVERCLAERRE